jgi:zinc transporter ZupT
MYLILFSAIAIMLCSLIGVFLISKKSDSSINKNLPYLVSFSAGVFLFTSGFMAYEAYHTLEDWILVFVLVLLGYTLATLLSKFYPKIHHHHFSESNCCSENKKGGWNVLFADAFHNIADGLVLFTTFSVSPALGLGTAVSIFIHESLQEVSEFFVLKKAGFSNKKALVYNFLVSSTILIGVFLGFALADSSKIQGILLSLSAGLFFYIITHDLIPQTHKETKSVFVKRLSSLVLGLLIILGVNSVTAGHNHDVVIEHDEHQDHEHDNENHHHGHAHD